MEQDNLVYGRVKSIVSVLACLTMLSFSGDPVLADYNNPDTDWMRDGKYGLHVKYLNWVGRNETTIEEFNQWVNAFDVNAFAEDVELTGASWVIWGLGRTWFNSPNATLESTVGDFTSDRDLPLEIYDALHERGIRLMLYAAGDKARTGEDRAGKVALGWDGTNDNYTRTFVNNWADALQVWSDRYGTKVSGWWFDHSNPNYAVSDTACGTSNPELAIYRTHLLSGNPDDGIVGINHGNRMGGELCHSPEDDYRAGHIRSDSLEVASSRWWNGLQWHYMFPIGTSGWGSPYVRRDTQGQIDYVNENNRNEGVNTFSVFVYTVPGESAEGVVKVPGHLSNAQLRQLAALRDASLGFVDNTSSDISFNGTWAKQDDGMDFRGSTSGSAVADNYAEVAFTGTGVEVAVRKGPNGGLVDVVLDDVVVVDDFDTYSSTSEYKQTIYDNQSLSSGSHTIRLVATGQKNASATAADAMLDYFAVTKLDTTAPRVLSIRSDATHPAKDSFTVTIDFLEDVTGLTAGEIAVSNGTGSNLAGTGASYTLDIEPIANLEGDVTVLVPVGAAVDGANNGNIEGSETFAVDAQAPAFQSAAVDGARLTLTYGEALDEGSRPAPGDFTVEVDGSGRSVSGVSVSGSVVTLTLNPAVEHGDTAIRVSYSPGTQPIQDAVGNDAGGLSNEPVTTLTFDLLAAPVITTTLPILVPENETAVAILTASDDDTPIDQLTWTIPSGTDGGADPDHFTLSEAGLLVFSAAKDYENPDDTDRTYELTVQVSDGDNPVTADILVTLENVLELLSELSGPASVSYGENGAARVATYSASSPEDNGDVTWSLSGTDSDHFSMDGGVLRFRALPDFESPSDAEMNNTYSATVAASDGSTTVTKDVTVTVTNVDEPGTLTLSPTRPRIGTALTAAVTDPDGVTGTTTWTWERSAGRNEWNVIGGAASSSHTPVAADAGHYLRATATYTDPHGTDRTARAVATSCRLGAQVEPARDFGP